MTRPTPIDVTRHRHPSTTTPSSARFAHPSEELFASLLTLYGLEWSYEPVEFPLSWGDDGKPTKGFRPDFYIASQRLFIELTVLEQRLVTKKNRKIRQFRALYPEVALLVVYQRDFAQLLQRHELDLPPYVAA